MRKAIGVTLGVSVALGLVLSCRGKEGPQGPPGPQGPAFSLPRDGFVRGRAIINDNSGRRFVKEFSYEYGYPGSIEQVNQDSFQISLQRYSDPNLIFAPPAQLGIGWNRANNAVQANYLGMTIFVSGQPGGTDSLLYYTLNHYPGNSTTVVQISGFTLGANRRATGQFLAVRLATGGNAVADTIQGSFDVPVQPERQLLRTRR